MIYLREIDENLIPIDAHAYTHTHTHSLSLSHTHTNLRRVRFSLLVLGSCGGFEPTRRRRRRRRRVFAGVVGCALCWQREENACSTLPYTLIFTYTLTRTHTLMHTHAHTHTHTHTHLACAAFLRLLQLPVLDSRCFLSFLSTHALRFGFLPVCVCVCVRVCYVNVCV
jgi:hypothetical protein